MTLNMKVKEEERIIVVKPVASRPTCSKLFSFSKISVGTADNLSSSACCKNAITVLRPKTVRLRPVVRRTPAGLVLPQPDNCEVPVFKSSDETKKSFNRSAVVNVPLEKSVWKASVSLLANPESSGSSYQEKLAYSKVNSQINNQEIHHLRSDFSSDLHENFPSLSGSEKTIEPSKTESNIFETDTKFLSTTGNGDSYSTDGYNWRKYGQKQVKGSEYPRSYYKCTHLKCPVKKKVERSLDGERMEIIYLGEHNHSKPCTLKCNSSGFLSTRNINITDNLLSSQLDGNSRSFEMNVKSQTEIGSAAHPMHSGYHGMNSMPCNLLTSGTFEASVLANGSSQNKANHFEGISEDLKGKADEPKSKRRKGVLQSDENNPESKEMQEPPMVLQSLRDSNNVKDCFRWRKYGQKVVKGNPYPRSYYRCTSPNCNVRKYVERASDDPTTLITTYEGKHNHGVPMKNTDIAAFEPLL